MSWITTTHLLEDLKSSNDSKAWESFRNHFYPVIVNFSKQLGLDSNYADDLAQETMLAFMQALRKGGYCKDKGKLSSWVFGIARRVMLNYRRRLPKEHIIADQTSGTSFWNMIEDDKAIQNTWEDQWRRVILQQCMSQCRKEFDHKVFEAFVLYGIEGVEIKEVCDKLDMSRNAVYIAKSRILSRLRQLQNDFDGDV